VIGRTSWLAEHNVVTMGDSADNLSVLHLAVDGTAVARFHLRDTIRPEAQDALRQLRNAGANVS
jgi:cation transport ATPase